MGAIAQASSVAPVISPQEKFKAKLEHYWPRIASVAPKAMNQERMFQLALSAYNQTPKLSECSIQSVLGCLMKCSALGMEPSAVDGLGRAYILPFYNKKTRCMEATFILGYKGMLDLARRSGQLTDISARVVREGDDFEYEYGLNEKLRHVPSAAPIGNRQMTHVYMVAHFKDGGHYIDVMTREEVEEIRSHSKAGDSGPWRSDYEAMAMKSVIRRAFKFLPVSVEAQSAANADDTVQVINESNEGDPIIAMPDASVIDVEAEVSNATIDPNTGEIKEANNA